MTAKADLAHAKLHPWNEYRNKPVDDALASIYQHAASTSRELCAWYWRSIRTKRQTSLAVRFIAFTLLIVGTALPILAGMLSSVEARLACTQMAVVVLAVAGLTQVADRVFGWSSGWMRYITTVTQMERLTRSFELEWASYLLDPSGPLTYVDVRALFDMAISLERDLLQQQSDETAGWVAEFNAGMSLLDTLIKTQREAHARTLESVRASIAQQQNARRATRAAETQTGAIEVDLSGAEEDQTASIALNDEASEAVLGGHWSRRGLAAGPHVLHLRTTGTPPRHIRQVVEVPANGVARLQIAWMA